MLSRKSFSICQKKVNYVTETLNRSQCFCVCFCACVCLLVGHGMSPYPSDQLSEKKQLSPTALHCSNDAEIKTFFYISGRTHTYISKKYWDGYISGVSCRNVILLIKLLWITLKLFFLSARLCSFVLIYLPIKLSWAINRKY